MSNYVILSDLIYKAKSEQPSVKSVDEIMTHFLNDNQVDELVKMIGYRCRHDTKAKLRRRLELPLALLRNHGIYCRVVITENGCDYICGQSWDDEMRTLSECLINN